MLADSVAVCRRVSLGRVWETLSRLLFAAVFLVRFAPAQPTVSEPNGNTIEVRVGGSRFTSYHYSPDVTKAYFTELRTAAGTVVSRTFPIINDVPESQRKAPHLEPHQRALYFGHGSINGLDFWAEPAFRELNQDSPYHAYGKMQIEDSPKFSQAGGKASIEAHFRLTTTEGRAIADEEQRFAVFNDSDARIIDCEFVIDARYGSVVFGDSKEGTFALRLRPELTEPAVKMINSNGRAGEQQIWGQPANWVAYEGMVEGKPVTVAVFDAPGSFRHPTTWHARGYGLLAANPFGKRYFTKDENQDGSWTVPEGKRIRFRYRVLLFDRLVSADDLRAAYDRFASQSAL